MFLLFCFHYGTDMHFHDILMYLNKKILYSIMKMLFLNPYGFLAL